MKSRRVATFVEDGKWTSGTDSTLLVGDWQAWVDGDGHWKVRGPDRDNEAHYADGDIELTEAEALEAGNSQARRKLRAQRAKKAARAYIKSMMAPAKAHHATRKKSPAQLDREIAEALSSVEPGLRGVARRSVDAEQRFIDYAMEHGRLSRGQASAALAALRKARVLKFDAVNGTFHVTHGQFLEPAVLRRAAGIEDARGAHATRRVSIGNGLKDGVGTAAAGYRLKKLQETGATDISLARTGRLRFTRNGQRYEYQVTPPRDRREADAFEAAGTVDSPLARALADITAVES